MRTKSFHTMLVASLAAFALAACNPAYNWRDYSSSDAPFSVMFPDKPSTHTREIDVGGMKVSMTMTAAQVEGTTFAVGSAEAPDAARAQAALEAMKLALVKNIGGTISSEKQVRSAAGNLAGTTQGGAIDIEASGTQKGTPMRLVAHFEARDKRFYQVIVMGRAKGMTRENVEMFMSSFKLRNAAAAPGP